MRIVAGEFGGRKLHVSNGRDVRPTSDKVRGAIFNALTSRIDLSSAHVMDIFCGTGALGLEAISRGATSCTFIDKARSSIDLAKLNARDLSVENRVQFIIKDATKLGVRSPDAIKANLIFLDPPYNQGLIIPCLTALRLGAWAYEGCLLVIESEKNFGDALPEGFQIQDERHYRDTKIMYVSYNAPE